jgi:hypothetical protein
MPASRAAARIAATQTTKAKKKIRKRADPAASTDTAAVSSNVETINVDDEEDDARSPSAAMVPATEMPHKAAAVEERATEMPYKAATMEERSRWGVNILEDAGSYKRAIRAPPKHMKPGFRSASK